ncbi:PREDICTED: uncharacterized protein LOC105154564 [Acromyrmex echinatior]|uniref:uncharacterized protein LOC105154564 n=1 Tax=Acromyrmex echinatior TaxID=103372 RepID=UPI0005810B69|nr:PREDICTED: uncharacterized protein LOC105154564 [Acromyrmex echinatior]
MAFVWKDYYSISKRVLLFCGQWPYQEKRARLFQLSTVTLVIFSQTFPQVAQIFNCDGNARCIQLTIPVLMLMVVFLVKLYTCQFNSNKVRQNLYLIGKYLFKFHYSLRSSDSPRDFTFIEDVFRSKVSLTSCVTIGRS